MQMQEKKAKHAAQRGPLPPAVKIVAAVLALALLTVVGIRLLRWTQQREEARVLVLVNPWNDVDNSGFRPKLTSVEGIQVDKSCVKALEQMMGDCRASGVSITWAFSSVRPLNSTMPSLAFLPTVILYGIPISSASLNGAAQALQQRS